MYRKSCCTTPSIGGGIGVGVSKMLKVLHKSFYEMGVALLGEISCTFLGFDSLLHVPHYTVW